jgi:hypothetical protein
MNARAPLLLSLLLSLAGCPKSREGQTASSSTAGTTAAGSGPLAAISARDGKEEMWKLEQGTLPFLRFDAQRVLISASCKAPSGALDCEAIRLLRAGPSIELGPGEQAGSVSAGTIACRKTKRTIVVGTGPTGAEDGFCKFADGSMVSLGALEVYAIK